VEYLETGSTLNADIPVVFDENIGSVVPQRITGKKDFKLSLRVRKPIKHCEIVIEQSGKILLRKKFPKAIPAEMIQLLVSKDTICTNEKIEVSVQ
jgi:hypothetical protein